ncbi:MAG: GntR family transcriptional regulator [Paeniglutamicibacter sp.]
MRIELDHRRGARPLYVQVAEALEKYIATNGLNPGDLLPGEVLIASTNELSRSTVAKALDVLVDSGLVTRKQGRGTFVSVPPMQRLLPELNSFSEHVASLGMKPGSELLSFDTFPVGATGRPVVPLDPGSGILIFERLRTVGGDPVGIHRTAVSLATAETIGLTEKKAADPDFSFYGLLMKHGIVLASGNETLRAVNATTQEAKTLGVPVGRALMEIIRQTFDPMGNLIEYVRARYLGSHYIYQMPFVSGTHSEIGPHAADANIGRLVGGYVQR